MSEKFRREAPGSVEDREKQAEKFEAFINDLNQKIQDLVEKNKEDYHVWEKIEALVYEEIKKNPPYFYSQKGEINSEVFDKRNYNNATFASHVAKLGQAHSGSHNTSVIEWNRKKGHDFILATFLPEIKYRPDGSSWGRSQQVYEPIPLEVAEKLTSEDKIKAELGYFGYEATGEDEDISDEDFTKPKLTANSSKDYTRPWEE